MFVKGRLMIEMKTIFTLAVFSLVINNGIGAPTARYMFVKCNPLDGQSNCVTHSGPEIELSPDLPSKILADASTIVGEPVVEEGPVTLPEEGSGSFEGSAFESEFMADIATALVSEVPEAGSGESWQYQELLKPHRSLVAQPAAQDLKDDHLLQP